MKGAVKFTAPSSMNYNLLDSIADKVNPLFAVLLILLAVAIQKKSSPLFILKSALAIIIVQQLAKWIQKAEFVSNNFPSTHYAVALSIAVSYLVLSRKLWPLSALLAFGYTALMLFVYVQFQKYHTPIELVGSVYAIPLTLLFHAIGRKRVQPVASN
jgi:membrane-associated phospholipid phosphatase